MGTNRFMKWARPALVAVGMGMAMPTMVGAAENFDQFFEHSEKEVVAITYDDWSRILKMTVFDAGMSDRSVALPPKPGIGRRFVQGNISTTRFEGNRVIFMAFKNDDIFELVHRIRRELEALPGAIPMAEWTKRQQLAYWLNLYNVAMIEKLAEAYPVGKIEKLLYGKKGILKEKFLTVAGAQLSLDDIHHKILIPNWHNPLIMYGMFHGYVGSPNLRRSAYTADTVYTMLKENAIEFINSNRGMKRKGSGLKVAELYEINKALFPNWPTDLKRHLETYASVDYVPLVRAASFVRTETRDYFIADLFQGVPSSVNPNEASFVGLITSLPGMGGGFADYLIESSTTATAFKFPFHVQDYVAKIQHKFRHREGTVEIEEFVEPEKSPEDEEAQSPAPE